MSSSRNNAVTSSVSSSSEGLVSFSSNATSENLDTGLLTMTGLPDFNRGINLAEFLEKELKNRRMEIIQPNGFISTPLHVMKTLALEHGIEVHTETFKISDLASKNIWWRVEVYVEETFGISVSPRRNLSLQLSAADLLQKVEKNYPNLEMPRYGLVTGSLIRASVHKDLFDYCEKNGFRNPVYKQLPISGTYPATPMFVICCKVAKKHTIGRSDNRILASRIAAKEMLEDISDEKYPNEVVKVGLECGDLESVGKLKTVPEMSQWKRQWMEMYANNHEIEQPDLDNVQANCVTSQQSDSTDEEDEEWFDTQTDNPNFEDIEVVILNSDPTV